MPIWGWVVLVLLIDVGHVWATLFRTYFDPEARAHNRDLLLFFPLLCFAGALGLALISEALFWRVLAYIALYHFIKQQYGITALYNVRVSSALIAPAKEPGASPLDHPPSPRQDLHLHRNRLPRPVLAHASPPQDLVVFTRRFCLVAALAAKALSWLCRSKRL